MALELQELCHECDDVGLADGLVVERGEWAIVVGLLLECGVDEEVSGDGAHGVEDACVSNVAREELVVDHLIGGGAELGFVEEEFWAGW